MFKATMKNGNVIHINEVSEMARKKNRLDYASMVDWSTYGHMVRLNVSPWSMAEDWEKQNDDEEDEEQEALPADNEEVFQWFIISEHSVEFFVHYTNELIYYSESLDMYLLGVTHFGTAWSGVMTEWKLEEE